MQIHELKKEYKTKKAKRIGRGGKRGTFSGKGSKGQRSRAGAKIRPAVYDLIIKIPKKRGVKNKPIKRTDLALFNLNIIEKYYHDGEIVSPQTLLAKGLINKRNSKMPIVKILGQGNLTKKVSFKKCHFSKQALAKIQPKVLNSKINSSEKITLEKSPSLKKKNNNNFKKEK